MKLNLRLRDIILIGSFWLVGCLLLGLVFYVGVWRNQPDPLLEGALRPVATYTVTFNEVTARNLQAQALEYAQSRWQVDAQLLSVSSTWEQTELHLVGQPTAWTYRFYAPGIRRLLFVTITPQGDLVGTLHTERLPKAASPIPIEAWQMDSPDAISTWLNYGGSTLLAALPGLQVVAQLKADEMGGPPVWIIGGYDPASQQYHSIFIDAQSQEVVEVKSSFQ